MYLTIGMLSQQNLKKQENTQVKYLAIGQSTGPSIPPLSRSTKTAIFSSGLALNAPVVPLKIRLNIAILVRSRVRHGDLTILTLISIRVEEDLAATHFRDAETAVRFRRILTLYIVVSLVEVSGGDAVFFEDLELPGFDECGSEENESGGEGELHVCCSGVGDSFWVSASLVDWAASRSSFAYRGW